jgi:Spy/CpxP family protein refolding chaperone
MKNLSIIMAFMLVTSVAFAGASKKKEGDEKRGERMRKELDLTSEQLAKMKEIRKKKKEVRKEARKKVREAREAFQASAGNPQTSNDELKAKFEELQTAQALHHRAGFETMLEIRSILNESQRAKFQEKRKMFRAKFEKRRKDSTKDGEESVE